MSSPGLTKIWQIKEAPQFEVEQTLGSWILWGPCCDNEDCVSCGGTNSGVIEVCGMDKEGTPLDKDMVKRHTGLTSWTPERLQ